jgi:hypothetical protein
MVLASPGPLLTLRDLMRKYLSHSETHHSVLCPPPHQTGVGIGCLEMTLDGNRGVTLC